MIAVVFFGVGAAASAALWTGLGPTFRSSSVLRRQNYRGREVPVASGVIVVLAVMFVAAGYSLLERAGGWSSAEVARGATVVHGLAGGATIAFGFAGLLDDLIGEVATKGFRGHLRALRHGQVTTGVVKLAVGVVAGTLAVGDDLASALRGGLLIAATANLANLFDRAPGRVIKAATLAGFGLALLGAPAWHLSGPMVVLGAGLGLLVPDLRERCMLGDTGANVLGAAVGWGVVLATGPVGEWVAVAVVVALNVCSEFVSFSRVIDRVAPLRWFDRLGSLPERRPNG